MDQLILETFWSHHVTYIQFGISDSVIHAKKPFKKKPDEISQHPGENDACVKLSVRMLCQVEIYGNFFQFSAPESYN